jgi:hypothetical protein
MDSPKFSTPPPRANPKYLEAEAKLQKISAQRAALEEEHEKAEAVLRDSRTRVGVSNRARAVLEGEPLVSARTPDATAYNDQLAVLDEAMRVAEQRRADAAREISQQVGIECREQWRSLVLASYAAAHALVVAGEAEDAFLRELQRGQVDVNQAGLRRSPAGCPRCNLPFDRDALRAHHQQLASHRGNPLSGSVFEDFQRSFEIDTSVEDPFS